MILTKIKKKFFKTIASFTPSNKLRILFLRSAGYVIGKSVYIGERFLISDMLSAKKNIIIEDRVSIAPVVTFITHSSPNNSRLIKKYPLISKTIIIKKDAWIGVGVIIMPGVEVGECSVIGSGSIVTSSIPSYSVAYGSPAKVINKINPYEL